MLKLDQLITKDYRAEQRALHLLPQGYGGKGSRWAETVLWVAKRFGCVSVLDYGCGMGTLKSAVAKRDAQLAVREYDPGIPGKDGPPFFADMVTCTDVLEHVEPELISNVLTHINGLTRRVAFLVVCLRPSNKRLRDGRNAHLLVRSSAWWGDTLREHHMHLVDVPDLPIPSKVDLEKHWIAVVRPS